MAGGGGGAFHPRRKRQGGGWEPGRACTQGQGHRAGWPEAALGQARAGIATHLGAALGLLLADKGLDPQKPDSVLYVPSHHPEQIKQLKGSGTGGQTGPPGQIVHLPGSPNSQWELIYLLPSFRPGRCLPAPLDQQGDP